MAQETTQETERVIPADQFRYRVLLARLHAGNLTTREAAARCGVTHASWSNWERGMKPRDLIEVVERISEGLGVDRDWLLFGGPLAPEDRSRPGRVLAKGRRLTGSYPTTIGSTTPGHPHGHPNRPVRSPLSSPARPPDRHDRTQTDRPVRLTRPATPKRTNRARGDGVL